MRSEDLRREENYQEFLRLKQNADYIYVTYDEKSGGMSAVHRLHKFDKQVGINGKRRGEYELQAMIVLMKKGHRVLLGSERSTMGIKICDGHIDDQRMEIKAIEGDGTWAVSTKLLNATKQHAQCVVLLFPDKQLYSEFRIQEGLRLYNSSPQIENISELESLIVIAEDSIVSYWNRKATPFEKEWLISEGLRGQNGAGPFTIPPSDAKL